MRVKREENKMKEGGRGVTRGEETREGLTRGNL